MSSTDLPGTWKLNSAGDLLASCEFPKTSSKIAHLISISALAALTSKCHVFFGWNNRALQHNTTTLFCKRTQNEGVIFYGSSVKGHYFIILWCRSFDNLYFCDIVRIISEHSYCTISTCPFLWTQWKLQTLHSRHIKLRAAGKHWALDRFPFILSCPHALSVIVDSIREQ